MRLFLISLSITFLNPKIILGFLFSTKNSLTCPSSILRLGPSYTIAEFNRRVNLRFYIDHRIAMAKKWRVKESEWILVGVFRKMRCDLFCFLFFSSKIYLTLTYSYFEKYYWLPPLILNGKRRKPTWGDKLFFFTNIKTDRFQTYDKALLK